MPTQDPNCKWYEIRRTYRVEDYVYVEASSANEARQKAWDFEFEFQRDPEAISDTRWGRAKRIESLPPDVLDGFYALPPDRDGES